MSKIKEKEELLFLGTMFAQNAYGNKDAKKVIDWYKDRLEEEMEKNLKLEIQSLENTRKSSWLSRIKKSIM